MKNIKFGRVASAAAIMLGSGILAPMGAFAEGEQNCFAVGDEAYATFGAARNALGDDGGTIKLMCDATTDLYFGVTKNVTLDLNGHKYTSASRGFQVKGNYTFTVMDSVGGGSLTGGDAAVDLYDGGKFVLESGNVYATDWGVIVFKDGEFIMNGGVVTCTNAEDGCYGVSGNGSATGDTAGVGGKITINRGTINSKELGIYAPQINGVTTLGSGAVINAKKAGVEVRAGELNVNGATINVDKDAEYVFNPNGNGSTASGVGIAVAQHTTTQPITVSINSGTFTAPVAFAEDNPQQNEDEDIAKVAVAITGGTFNATNGAPVVASTDVTKFITGGTYNKAVDEKYIADGYVAVEDGDNYKVAPLVTDITLGYGDEKVELYTNENQILRISYNPENAPVEFEASTNNPDLFQEGSLKIVEENGVYAVSFITRRSGDGEGVVTVTEKNSGVSQSVKVIVTEVMYSSDAVAEDGTTAFVGFKNPIEGEDLAVRITGEELTTEEKSKISPYLKAAYDLSVVNQATGEVVPVSDNEIDVTLILKKADYEGMKYFKVGYINDEGKLVEVFDADVDYHDEDEEENEYFSLSFTTTHFSTYGILASATEFPEVLTPDTGMFTGDETNLLSNLGVKAAITVGAFVVIALIGLACKLSKR